MKRLQAEAGFSACGKYSACTGVAKSKEASRPKGPHSRMRDVEPMLHGCVHRVWKQT